MSYAQGNAPGKIILFGEHAVVYGRPALAIPLPDLQATVRAQSGMAGQGILIETTADATHQITPDHPLAKAAQLTIEHLSIAEPDVTLSISSTIPIASGLGSGAAVTTALARALAAFAGSTIAPEELSPLVYRVEKLFHGTPSGIDNTVIVYELPVFFQRRDPHPPRIETFRVGAALHLLVADTGIASPTKVTVGDVRRAWQKDRASYESHFDRIGTIARQARNAIEGGDVSALGPLLRENQMLLRTLDVSSPQIEALVAAALQAGAHGAKLSGGGRGGNVIALVDVDKSEEVSEAIQSAGATRVICTTLRPTSL